MNDSQPAESGRRRFPRWLVRTVAVTVPVVALSGLAMGVASADEGFTPMDAFVDHWKEYHYGKPITDEPSTIVEDPAGYVEIHQEMADHMLGH